MTRTLPEGRPLKEFTFEDLVSHQRAGEIAGWVYPKRSVSQAIELFDGPRQAALNLWGWIAIVFFLSGIAVPALTGNLLWGLLIPLAYLLWKANRQSMEQFFLEQLVENKVYFEKLAQADLVHVVLKGEGVSS